MKEGEIVRNTRRLHHTDIIGKTGMGKSTLLERVAIDDIANGDGVIFFDIHGTSTDVILEYIPAERVNDVILFDVSDRDFPIGFNPLHGIAEDRKAFVASTFLDTVHSVWKYSIPTPTLDENLFNANSALLHVPDGTLLGIYFMLISDTYRAEVLSHVKDSFLKTLWTTFEEMSEKERRETTRSTRNKLSALFADPLIRNILGQVQSGLDLKDVLENGRVLLIKIPQGVLGLEKARILGQLLLAQVHTLSLERKATVPVHIFIDEAHHFMNASLREMLSGIRKFNVSLTLAHQYLDQLAREDQSAVLGTVGTLIVFRVSGDDARRLEPEFELSEQKSDTFLPNLQPFEAYAKTDRVHHVQTLMISKSKNLSAPNQIRQASRALAVQRKHIERDLNTFIATT